MAPGATIPIRERFRSSRSGDGSESRGRYYLKLTGIGALYLLAGMAGLAVPFTAGNVSPVWPASGVALACLLLLGRHYWPAIAVAAFLVNFLFSPLPLVVAIGLAVGNALAALTATFLLERLQGFRSDLTRLKDMLGLVGLAAVLSPIVSATIGTVVLFRFGIRPWETPAHAWLMYYLGDALGILLVTPVLVGLRGLWKVRSRKGYLELGAVIFFASLTSLVLFYGRVRFVDEHDVLVLLVYPFLLWAAIRFGVPGVALTIAGIGSVAVLATARDHGPFSGNTPFINALLLQLFMATLAISGLILAAVIAERQRLQEEREALSRNERQRFEEEAQKSRIELRSVLDNSPALIYMKDPAGRYLYVNHCWSELLHTPSEQATGKTDFELFPEEAARQFVANDRAVMASGKALEFEEQARMADGLHSYQSIKVALRDGSGSLYGLCGISTDISERKIKEESLRQIHRALRVLSNCNSAVVHATEEQSLLDEVCRVAVGPAGYLLAWVGYAENDEAQTVRPVAFAGPAEGFLDRIHVSWGNNEYGRGSVGPAIRTGKPVVVRRLQENAAFAIWRDALENRNFESVLSVPLCEGGRAYGALAIYAGEADAFDSTELELLIKLGENLAHGISSLRIRSERDGAMSALIKSQQELEQRVRQRTAELEQAKDAAESADRLKSAFLATMSHELRTPLNSIIGFTGILVKELGGPLNQEQKKQLGMVQNSARHLLALINDVLDISKIEAGQLELHCARFSLPGSVHSTVAIVAPLADKKGILLHTEISPEVNYVFGDQRRTEQILLNLLGNALKFTDSGDVTVRCSLDSGSLIVAVQDSGIGIDLKDHETIFQPFRQTDTGLARKREGTGLGLSICKRLTERMGGSISVSSSLGKGSIFTVRLPYEPDVIHEQNNSHH